MRSFTYNFLGELVKLIDEVLRNKDTVLVSVVGKNGTGKSYFGRYMRKKGVGHFNKKSISVIDDRVAVMKVLFFFKRKVRIPRNGVDDLQPFLKNLPRGKKVILYINNTPADKIKKADILLKLTTDEEIRRKRLEKRYPNDPEKLEKYLNIDGARDFDIKYTYFLEAKI